MADGLSVFLVEDEALIRMMIADMVEELGHHVVAEADNIQDGHGLRTGVAAVLAPAQADPAKADLHRPTQGDHRFSFSRPVHHASERIGLTHAYGE
jgi:CheY-like chemotaxis protein